MLWHKRLLMRSVGPSLKLGYRYFSASTQCSIKLVPNLSSWDLDAFTDTAFGPAVPAKLPLIPSTLLPACRKWFIHENEIDWDRSPLTPLPVTSELNLPFWKQYQHLTVPIELTQTINGGTTFQRHDGRLKFFLDHSTSPISASRSSSSLYIAQCPLVDLPASLQADVPTPSLVLNAGKGDVYDSSLWMGQPPTFTPLHRDPNPNLFMQLAGQKVIRLFPPEVGRAIFDAVSRAGHAVFRGEEMMQGSERQALEEAVWNESQDELERLRRQGSQAQLHLGEALFVPKGWWHSVRGVGSGINASANWWFR